MGSRLPEAPEHGRRRGDGEEGAGDLNPRDVAALLPDVPRWVEARGILLSGRCEVRGLDPGGPSFVVRSTILPIVAVAGRPDPDAIRASIAAMPVVPHAPAELLVPDDEADPVTALLPEWRREPTTLHTLAPGAGAGAASPADPEVRLLAPHETSLLRGFPGELAADLALALPWFPTAAAFVDGRPVSFCYASAPTETLWDVSIETLEPYRRRGLAAKCVRFLIARMRRFGKEPVWGAFDSNEGSLGLAAHLGFRPVDRLTVLYAPQD